MKSCNYLLLTILLIVAPFNETRAKEDPLESAVKSAGISIATFAVKKLVGALYKDECRGNSSGDDIGQKAHNLLCGAMGGFSGETEAEWKKNITDKLQSLSEAVDRIESELLNLKRNQEAMLKQGEKVLGKLKVLANEIIISTSLTSINGLWEDQFEPLFNGEKAFNQDGLLMFAQDIIFESKVHKQLSDVHQSLTRNVIKNRDGWIKSYMDELNEQFKNNGTPKEALGNADFSLLMDYSESVISDLIAQQTKGYSMYVWAAKIIEQHCQINQQCELKNRLPHTAEAYHNLFQSHIQKQLYLYSAGIDQVVLDRSTYSSAQANFLAHRASEIFTRVDAFMAMQLGKAGVRGRVISMGDAWDGVLTISGQRHLPVHTSQNVVREDLVYPHKQTHADWWTSSQNDGVYDVVHKSQHWKVHYYDLPLDQPRNLIIENQLPHKPDKITLGLLDMKAKKIVKQVNDHTQVFGSFTAIERAGGGFAFLSSPWVGGSTGNLSGMSYDAAKRQVTIESKSEIKGGKESRSGRVYLQRKHPITFADSGTVQLLAFAPTNHADCPRGNCNTIEIKTNYTGTDFAKLRASAGVMLDDLPEQNTEQLLELKTQTKQAKQGQVNTSGGQPSQVAVGDTYHAVLYATFDWDAPSFLLGTTEVSGFVNFRLSHAVLVYK